MVASLLCLGCLAQASGFRVFLLGITCDPKPYKIVGYDPLIRW